MELRRGEGLSYVAKEIRKCRSKVEKGKKVGNMEVEVGNFGVNGQEKITIESEISE